MQMALEFNDVKLSEGLRVQEIDKKLAHPFILNVHYAHRLPSISYAYGLYDGSELIGICTYGSPPSNAFYTRRFIIVCGYHGRRAQE